MTDVLTVLHSLLHRVSSVMMPTELNDVLQFLRGNQWHRVGARTTGASTAAPAPAHASSTDSASSSKPPPLATQGQARYVPDGRVAHHGFIPLAIAADALISLASGGDRSLLQQLFCRHGFEKVVSVNLSPTGASSSPSGSAASESASDNAFGGHGGAAQREGGGVNGTARVNDRLARRRGRGEEDEAWCTIDAENTTAGRLTCLDAVRGWFSDVEEEARREAGRGERARRAHLVEAMPTQPEAAISTVRVPYTSAVTHSLLLVVRCTADNREFVQSSSGPASGKGVGPVAGARRFGQRADPLFLFLHDLAALQTLYSVRLGRFAGVHAHVAVLLLPDDHVYGGILLQQRLQSEVAYRFLVRLFQDDEDPHVMTSDIPHGTVSERVLSDTPTVRFALSTRWSRAGRLLDLWEPDWTSRLRASAMANGEPPSVATCEEDAAPLVITDAMLEHYLARRRGDGAFFLRPSNLPLCAFLREALVRFPVLLQPAHLRLLQAAWTSRHALVDVLWAYHALLMPFTLTGKAATPVTETPGPSSPSSSPSAFLTTRQRCLYGDVYGDTTTLMDALLQVASTMTAAQLTNVKANSSTHATVPGASLATIALDEVVAFMLLYDELSRHESGIHVLRAEPVVAALSTLYRREAGLAVRMPVSSSLQKRKSLQDPLALSEAEQARHALVHLLPFHQPNALCGGASTTRKTRKEEALRWPVRLPAVMRVSGVRLGVAGALQSAAVTAVLSPEASLKEVVEVASGLKASVSADNFYSPLTPDAVRVVNVLAMKAVYATDERDKHVPLVQLQQVCQLSDEGLLQVLHELQCLGFIAVNALRQTARSLLGG